jgi:hypothetical protein
MNRKKSWIYIILFALSINLLHGFFIHHYEHVHSCHAKKELKEAHHLTHDICDKCQHIHLNFIVDISKIELPYIEQNRAIFSDKKLLISTFFPKLLRPPIV